MQITILNLPTWIKLKDKLPSDGMGVLGLVDDEYGDGEGLGAGEGFGRGDGEGGGRCGESWNGHAFGHGNGRGFGDGHSSGYYTEEGSI